jgi:hypothetical protein
MWYYLIVWMESQQCWHEIEDFRAPSLRHALAIARNTHPRLRGRWAVVPRDQLEEAMASDPRPSMREEYLRRAG